MNEYCVPPDAVIRVNATIICSDGFNLLDRGKLESALAAPLQTFFGRYLVESSIERASMLLEGIIHAHAFIDGNKRTAWVVTSYYLNNEGFPLTDIADTVVADFVGSVPSMDHALAGKEITRWLVDHLDC